MSSKRFIPFTITSMDSLGQGVSKETDKVTFIPKTVVGDQGEAQIMSEKKGVAFARISQLKTISSKRITPACEHFSNCPSCHYLHVDYDQELLFKKESFEKLFRKWPDIEPKVIGAPERFHYRNRVQLHYSLKTKLLGMRDPQTFQITPIPSCLIGVPEVLEELKRLYTNQAWLQEAPSDRPDGHVEIYWVNNELKCTWNKSYAEGGFTQIYELMNQKLKTILSEEWITDPQSDLLDLFAGNGNLSNDLKYSNRLCVDVYSKSVDDSFLNQDLYDEKALKNVLAKITKNSLRIKHLLLDPPRSGLKNLKDWVLAIDPQTIAYVSCDPHTMARDLMGLTGYQITNAYLVDFFPSTFHFESMIFLERKN